jgi:hypothetical protein
VTLRLHDYQLVAVDHIHRNEDGAGLFLEPGLGKTCVALTALEPRHLPALVIAPKRVAENVWPAERKKWRPDLSLALAAGSPAKRKAAIRELADITVIGRDNLKDVPVGIYKTVILDELSSFKSRASQRWKMARQFCKTAKYVWGLTGTPAPNGLLDLWAQCFLVDSGASLGRTLGSYRDRHFTPKPALRNGVIPGWDLDPGEDEVIHALLEKRYLSMKAVDHLDMPDRVFNPIKVTLPPKARRAYDQMASRDMVARFENGEVRTADGAAAATNRLSQIAAGFLYPDTDGHLLDQTDTLWLHDEKTAALVDKLEEIQTPVLVAYRYQEERDRILKAVPHAVPIEKFDQAAWDAGDIPVLVTHPQSAGHGLNLQYAGAHNIIWTSLTWSLEEWDQFNARLWRQGQKDTVIIHALMAEDTIDEAIKMRVEDKIDVQDALMVHLAPIW